MNGPFTVACCDRTDSLRSLLFFDRIVYTGDRDPRVHRDYRPDLFIFDQQAADRAWASFPDDLLHEAAVWPGVQLQIIRALCQEYSSFGFDVVPIYPPKERVEGWNYYIRYNTQSNSTPNVMEFALSHIPTPDVAALSFDQVVDFRADAEAARKLRNFRHWIKNIMNANSEQEAIDIIGNNLEAYEWALKKHGIQTVIGAINQLVNWKPAAVTGIAALGAAQVSGEIAGIITGTAVFFVTLTAQVTAFVLESNIKKKDLYMSPGGEVAYLFDVKNKFGA
ncbi:hypothetical protein [Paraburkholderia sp.]|uniref:hypothetical protein n=1 Tax=Paraburkholderia sp. TaxID=1926495 RepID=UPI003C7CAB6F